jgi:anaerobic magnesium-protoporphyrin IX monomethyl ester cyclase
MYIAAVLREAGHGVTIVATGLREDNNLQPSDIMDADLVGITSTSALFPKAQAVLSTIRSWRPELPVMLGGAHATICTEHGLRSGFDWAVIGEAEKTIVEFAANLERGCPKETRGIAFIDDTDSVHKTPAQDLIEDLDTLPFPARDLYDYDAFRAHGGWEFGMLSSRGCPFKCTFCQPTLNMIFGHMRKRGPENVAAEMAELAEHYNPPILYFKDDTLSANGMKWFDRFRTALSERNVNLQWKCNTRVDKVGPRILDAMQEAGCVEVEQTYQLMELIQPDHFWVFFATALPGKDLTKYVVEHNLLKRNLGYHYYDTAMNGVYGSANIELESITYEQMVAMRNRILGLQQGSNQEETALRHGIPQHAPQRNVRR